ncbi:MAG: SRPBCC family protein [Chloroflexi bacterium]|nr:SRPBCC family protein [Chloroflexota bacterium]MBP8056675.1 SRPBCC family protein [Chloroflexota bacterium]
MKISHAIEIHNTPEKVFHWLNNPKRAMSWMASVAKTEILHETPDMVGTTFREIVAENGQETELYGVVTDYRPNQLIAFHLSGKFNVVDVAYYLEGIANGTRLTQRADIRFKAFLKLLSILIGPILKKNLMAQSQKEFARLKELCEQDTSD